jgi:hypothetical protein
MTRKDQALHAKYRQRRFEIHAAVQSDRTMVDVAKQYGITPVRVREIVRRTEREIDWIERRTMTDGIPAPQAKEIMRLVANGTDPSEAIAQVMEREAEPKPLKLATPKANTDPATKKRLKAWLLENVAIVEQEYMFHPTRKWLFDFFLPDHNIAVEYEGFMTQGANVGHASIAGIMRDVEKYNEAQAMGIRVFRATAENIRTGSFFELMERVLGEG